MAQSILQLKVDDKQYNSSLRSARQGLSALEESLRKCGGSFNTVDKDVLQYTQSLGRMTTTATTAKGKVGEMTSTFTELSTLYRRLTDEERNSPFGKALSQSLDQLKVRIADSKKELAEIQNELGGSKAGFSDFSSILGDLGGKLGINSDLMGLVTTGTIGMTAAIGAAATAVAYATEQWAAYNSELAKQDQVTTVTTGLKGEDMEALTNAAHAMADVYGVDFREVINAANTLMTQFGQSGEQATQLIRDGMQGMIQGDGPKLLSMIQQFAPSFRDAGISASQLVAIIHNSEGGIFTDQNMNAITMGIKNIRNMTDSTSEALQKLGISGKEMTQKLNDGTMTIFEALQIVAGAIEDVGSGSQAAGQVMQQVFGRQGAMAGTKLGEAIATLNTNLEETKNQTGAVGESLARLEQSHEQLEAAMRSAFGYKGWEEMSNSLKNDLYVSLTNVVSGIDKVKSAMEAVYAPVMAVNDAMYGWLLNSIDKTEALKATILGLTGPLGQVINMLDAIGSVNLTNVAQDAYDKKMKEVEGQMKGTPGTFYVSNPEPRRAGNGFTPSVTTTASRTTGRTGGGGGRAGRVGTGRTGGGRTGRVTETLEQRTSKEIDKAQKAYADTINAARQKMETGISTSAQYDADILNAEKKLADSYMKAYNATGDEQYLSSFKTTAEHVTQMQQVVDDNTAAIAEAKKAAQEQAASAKKLNEAQEKVAKAYTENDLGAFLTANRNLSSLGVDSGITPDMFGLTNKNIEAYISDIKTQLSSADLGSDLFMKLTEQLRDATLMSDVLQESLTAGLDGADLSELAEELKKKLLEGDISDEAWQAFQEKINQKLQDSGIDGGISIDTKNNKVGQKEKDNDETFVQEFMKTGNQLVSGLNSVSSGLQQMGIKIPDSITRALSYMQGLMTTIQGVATIISLFKTTTMSTQTVTVSANTAALVTLDAEVAGLIAVITANTASNMIPFAGGGIIRAANGYRVPGNSFSGDTVPILANSGELILNKAQQSALASELNASPSKFHLETRIEGDDLVLVLKNNDAYWNRTNYYD